MKKVIKFLVDFDGCFSPSHITIEAGMFRVSGPIIEHMVTKINELEPDIVEIVSFSNRQDFIMDATNSDGKPSVSSLQAFTALAHTLKLHCPHISVVLDQYLLADSASNQAPGSLWKEVLSYLLRGGHYPLKRSECGALPPLLKPFAIFDKRKLLMLYLLAHRTCAHYAETTKVHFFIYEDDEKNLQELFNFSWKYASILPDNLYIEMYAFNSIHSTKLADYAARAGTGQTTILPGIKIELGQIIQEPEKYPYISPIDPRTAWFKKDDITQQTAMAMTSTSRGIACLGETNFSWQNFYTAFCQQLPGLKDSDSLFAALEDKGVVGTSNLINSIHQKSASLPRAVSRTWFKPIDPNKQGLVEIAPVTEASARYLGRLAYPAFPAMTATNAETWRPIFWFKLGAGQI